MLASNQYQAELLIANAILHAGGTYIQPVFGELNKPYFNGNYYSYRVFTSAGRYGSSQVWSGSNGVIMEGDPSIIQGRNDLTGGSGNDVLYSGAAETAFIYGLDGNDTIVGYNALDAQGGLGNDVIIGGVAINANGSGIYLTEWQKKLANASDLSADALHNLFNYSDGQCTMYGGEGNDILIALNDQNHKLYGDDSVISSGTGNDTIIAGDGNNTIVGGGGDDLIVVGNGENNINAGSGDDYIIAEGNFSTTIDAGSGNDTIILSGEIGTLYGGDGIDLVTFENSSTGLTIYLNSLYEVELVGGTNLGDTMMGTSVSDYMDGLGGNDLLRGGAGNDTIYGNIGNDSLFGEAGDDDLHGGQGNDLLYGGIGDDFYYFEGNFGVDQVYEYANEGSDDRVIFKDLKMSDIVYGRSGNDLMFGNADQSQIVAIRDWFVNFGIDSVWFTTGTQNQYNYVTAETLAELFGVEIPTASDSSALILDDAVAANEMSASSGLMSGDTLVNVAIEVAGVDLAHEDVPISC